MDVKKTIINIFDYQKFDGSPVLEAVISESRRRRRAGLRMLSDGELGLVSGGTGNTDTETEKEPQE